jgi:hypothetical protein
VSINEFDSEGGRNGLDAIGSLFRRHETTPRNRAVDTESDLALFDSEGELECPPVVAVAVPVSPPAAAQPIHVPSALIIGVAMVLGVAIGLGYARVARPFEKAVPDVSASNAPLGESPLASDPPQKVATPTGTTGAAVSESLPTPVRNQRTAAIPSGPAPNRVSNRTAGRVPDRVPSRAATTARQVAPDASIAREHERIRGLLNSYKVAYEQLDAAAASTLWSGVDMRAVARASGALGSHSVSFDRCDITVAGRRATASCDGPSVGAVEPRRASWTFALDRDSGDWRIAGVSAR